MATLWVVNDKEIAIFFFWISFNDVIDNDKKKYLIVNDTIYGLNILEHTITADKLMTIQQTTVLNAKSTTDLCFNSFA